MGFLSFTTDDLVAAVRKTGYFPDTGGIADSEIREFLNLVRRSEVQDLIRRASPSFWRAHQDYTLVAGQATYAIPDRAMMNGIDRVVLVHPTSGEEVPIDEIDHSEQWRHSTGSRDQRWSSIFAHVMDAEHVRLVPTPTAAEAGYTLRVYYYRGMSEMVSTSRSASISRAVDSTTIRYATVGSEAATLRIAPALGSGLIDIVRGAGMFGPIYESVVIDSYSAPDATLAEAIDTDLIATSSYLRQDYACIPGETVYPEVPKDVWPVLVHLTTEQCLIATKDFDHARVERGKADAAIAACRFLAEPRSQEPDVIINRHSPGRRSRFGR